MIYLPVDVQLKSYLHALFPGIAISEVREITMGWNSRIAVVNEQYVVKIPRTVSGRKSVEKENEISNCVREYIPVQIPKYLKFLRGDNLFAAAYGFIPGYVMTTINNSCEGGCINPNRDFTETQKEKMEIQLADILNSIHRIPLAKVKSILARYDPDSWTEEYSREIEVWRVAASRVFTGIELRKCYRILDEVEDCLTQTGVTERFIHGDFGGWNMIYDTGREEITGLLDWSDSGMGDPAIDFTEILYDFGNEVANSVYSMYQFREDRSLLERARCILKQEGFRDLDYGAETGSQELIARGKRAIKRLLKSTTA